MNLMVIGLIGMVCFSLSGLPQLLKAIKEGHSDGMAAGTIWLWLTGEFCYICYTLANYSSDFVLMINYVFNFSIVESPGASGVLVVSGACSVAFVIFSMGGSFCSASA